MIHFSEIANPPQPTYRPMCVACDGRGVVPSLSRESVQRCEQCNGTGKEGNTPEPAYAALPTANGPTTVTAAIALMPGLYSRMLMA